MIHHLVEEMDAGEPVVTREILFVVGEDEDLVKFEEKVHLVEHEVVLEGVRKVVTEIRNRGITDSSISGRESPGISSTIS